VRSIGSGEHPAGRGPRTVLRPLGEDDRGGEESEPGDNQKVAIFLIVA
jgi:hypothetical protein